MPSTAWNSSSTSSYTSLLNAAPAQRYCSGKIKEKLKCSPMTAHEALSSGDNPRKTSSSNAYSSRDVSRLCASSNANISLALDCSAMLLSSFSPIFRPTPCNSRVNNNNGQTQFFACDVWRVAFVKWRVACGVWRVACGVWVGRLTFDVWRLTFDNWRWAFDV